jgi:glycosyltransferase involved in cell wall biosynthesis
VDKPTAILFGPLPPPYGGVSVFMDTIRDAAISRGVRVWSYTGRPQEKDSGQVRFVNHRRFGHILALIREGRKGRITDSTHFHLENPNVLVLPLWVLAKFFLGFTWIKLLHDGSLPSRFTTFSHRQKWLFRMAIRNIDEFIVYSRDLESWLRREARFAGKIWFIPLLLPLPTNWGREPLAAPLLEKLDRFSERKRSVCSIGVFIPSYGFHHVVEAIEILRSETNEDIGLLLLDGHFAFDAAYRNKVLAGRDWIEVAENVRNPCLKEVFSRCDVFVRAFEHESFGLSRIEALWCGTPVIATNVGETRGMLLYDFGDVERLRGNLETVFDGDHGIDIPMWAAVFKDEAKDNLKDYLSVLTGEATETCAD